MNKILKIWEKYKNIIEALESDQKHEETGRDPTLERRELHGVEFIIVQLLLMGNIQSPMPFCVWLEIKCKASILLA